MINTTKSRQMFDALSPDGSIWKPQRDGDMDKLHEGLSDNNETVRQFLKTLQSIRDPLKTSILSDMEVEFGITPNAMLTDAQRRAKLVQRKYQRYSRGTKNDMQKALDDAGFGAGGYGLHVYEYPLLLASFGSGWSESPILTNPATFLTNAWHDYCGKIESLCGYNLGAQVLCQCAQTGGQLVVNGDIYQQYPIYHGCSLTGDVRCDPFATAPNVCGYFTAMKQIPFVYTVPTDPANWPLIFFIAPSVSYDGITGAIINFGMASIPENQKDDLVTLILRVKPMHSWCGLMVIFS